MSIKRSPSLFLSTFCFSPVDQRQVIWSDIFINAFVEWGDLDDHDSKVSNAIRTRNLVWASEL